jgi:nitroimidazol reductase NimA-like FMN-containing flavoprotein (pyridoxamine 5'-phosphate oxidase superfamily)
LQGPFVESCRSAVAVLAVATDKMADASAATTAAVATFRITVDLLSRVGARQSRTGDTADTRLISWHVMTNDDIARTLLDANSYVVLATADAAGVPWASPVWFAQENYREIVWVSDPGARHSMNIAVRPLLSMVVFDSTVAPNTGQAVYMSATAELVDDPAALERELGLFSRVAVRKGLGEWGLERVTGTARLRLYRATVIEHFILDPDAVREQRVAVSP